MPRHVTLHPHLTTEELERRYRSEHEPHERSWWQILWLLSRGQSARQVAQSKGYSPYWIGQLTKRYNTEGPAGTRNRARFYDLHHTCATLLLAQGVDLRTIMETLGHSQISLTMNTYAHVIPALQRLARWTTRCERLHDEQSCPNSRTAARLDAGWTLL